MKKIQILLFLAFFIAGFNQVFANDFSVKNEARHVIKQRNQALLKHNVEKVKTFYSDEYLSSDGFNKSNMEEMLKKTYDVYKNIKYKTKINNITIFDDTAVVQLTDETKAQVPPGEAKNIKKDKMGKLYGKSSYIVYLRKDENNSFKIVSDRVLMEETSLKYGIANKIKINFETPLFVDEGKEYDLKLNMEKPDDIIALASLSREEIVYPTPNYPEKFRKMPTEGNLERIVKANNKHRDECAVASIGFTKVSYNEEETKARIEILGMAYFIKRVNLNRNFGDKK